jgi:hypothetical protein
MCWFAIPFSLATSLGLASRALDLPITPAEAGAGLVPPAVAVHILGSGGAVLILLQLFMAVTSTGSAEQIAVASLVAYDIYRQYINPKATGQQIINVSRYVIVAYGILSGILAVILLALGLSLGWVYLAMGVLIGSAVFPISLSLTWKRCSAAAAITGAIGGLMLGILTWCCIAYAESGEVTIATLGKDFPMLGGNLVSILSSGLLCFVVSIFVPQNYDFSLLKNAITVVEQDGSDELPEDGEDSADGLVRALKIVLIYGSALTFLLVVLWPLLTIPAGVFSEGYFTFWVAISMIWGLVATALMIIMPVWESRQGLIEVCARVIKGDKNSADFHNPSAKKFEDPSVQSGDGSVIKAVAGTAV